MSHHIAKQTHDLSKITANWIVITFYYVVPLDISTSIVTLLWFSFKKKKKILPFTVCDGNGATSLDLTSPLVYGRCCTADTEGIRFLTDAYLTSHIFKVLYVYLRYSNCNLIYTANGFLYSFLVCQCLRVLFCFFFFYYEITLIFSNFQLFLSHL